MPLYEYECKTHGRFDAFQSISHHSEPANCPVCGASCGRVISVPRFRSMASSDVRAHDVNEKSKHEPHVCGSGCNHNHGKSKIKKDAEGQPMLQPYKGKRPWVVEHA